MNIGIEIEFTGVERQKAAIALKNYFENMKDKQGLCDIEKCDEVCDRKYEAYDFIDSMHRVWTLSQDVSIRTELSENGDNSMRCLHKGHTFANELQIPVLNTDNSVDMEMLHDCLLVLRAIEGVVNDSCATHIHIDAPEEHVFGHYLNQYVKQQYAQYKLFSVAENKIVKYAKPYTVEVDFETLDSYSKMCDYIRSNYGADMKHFNINFGAYAEHGTIEFRAFNSTLDFNRMMSYINWVCDFCKSCRV